MIVALPLAAAAMAPTPVRVQVQLDAAGKVTDCATLEGPIQGSDTRRICMAMLRGAVRAWSRRSWQPGLIENGDDCQHTYAARDGS